MSLHSDRHAPCPELSAAFAEIAASPPALHLASDKITSPPEDLFRLLHWRRPTEFRVEPLKVIARGLLAVFVH